MNYFFILKNFFFIVAIIEEDFSNMSKEDLDPYKNLFGFDLIFTFLPLNV